jgi:hypothetical protein
MTDSPESEKNFWPALEIRLSNPVNIARLLFSCKDRVSIDMG